MKINIQELKKATQSLFSYLDEHKIKELEVDEDYYWIITDDELYKIDKEPSKHTIGQLSEDWDFLMKMTKDQYICGPGFIWLSRIFRVLGEKII